MVSSMRSTRGYCAVLLRALFVFACADRLSATDNAEVLSVGKIRASADLAFSKGEVDNALSLWKKVSQITGRFQILPLNVFCLQGY